MPGPDNPVQIRAFVAVCLEPHLIERIHRTQEHLEEQCGPGMVRWTHPDQLHLTLRFFGNVRGEELASLQLALQESTKGVAAFHLSIKGLGCFPSFQRPRVVWLGMDGDLAVLNQLQQQVERECRHFGSHSEDRAFQPHLTIGRVKAVGAGARKVGDAVSANAVQELGLWPVNEIQLMQSRLSPQGSTYRPLLRIQLHSDRVLR